MFYPGIVRIAARVVVSALTGAALMGSTVGCYSHRPYSTPTTGQSGRLRLVRDAPVAIVRGKAGSDTLLLRSVSELEGKLVRVTPDTLALMVERSWPYTRQATNQLAIIPRTASMDFAARKLDEGRTMVLFAGASLAMIFLVYALTWDIDFGSPSSGGY